MASEVHNILWRDFPKTATDFEKRFATEEDCRAYLIAARWGGAPECARCSSKRLWTLADGVRFECAACGHQTSLTAGTVLEKTRKPLKMWFRAIFEITTRHTGISAKDLQRLMGFGSYETAWTWLHKLRSAMVRSDSEPMGPFVQLDETLVGGKGGPHKQLVLVASECGGRARLVHADNNDTETCKRFADEEIAADASVVTDGHAGYSENSLGQRRHEAVVQTKAERRQADALQACHWMTSLTKRWLLGTHAGAVAPKHLQAYLDEFTFRHNRRKTKGVGRIAARLIEAIVLRPPLTMRAVVDQAMPFRRLQSPVARG
jgi:transposase-like protein